MPRHRKYTVHLSDEDVQRLKKLVRDVKTPQAIRCRCQILLLLDLAHGQTYDYEECATVTGSCIATVSNTNKNVLHRWIGEVACLGKKGQFGQCQTQGLMGVQKQRSLRLPADLFRTAIADGH